MTTDALAPSTQAGGTNDARYRSLVGPARWAIGLLVLAALVDVVALVFDVRDLRLYDGLGSEGELAALQGPVARDGLVRELQLLAFFVTAIVFLWWFRRAYRNLRAFDGLQRYRQGWAVGAWFVPILNVFRPKQMINDIWRGSDPRHPLAGAFGTESVSVLLGWWWGVFLLSTIVFNRVDRVVSDAASASELRDAYAVSAFSDVLDVAAAGLAIAVVLAVTKRQAARSAAQFR